MLHFVCCGIWSFWWQLARLKSALQVVKWLNVVLLSVYSTNCLGVLVCQKQGGHAVLKHYILTMELWVHVSRLPMPDLDSDQWKHFILNNLLLMGGDATQIFSSILLLHALHTLDCNCTFQNNPRLSFIFCKKNFFFVGNFSFFTCTPSSCACAHVCFIPSHSPSFIKNILLSCGWWCNSSSLSSSCTPPSAHVISYHSPQLSSQCQVFLHMHKTTSAKLWGLGFIEH